MRVIVDVSRPFQPTGGTLKLLSGDAWCQMPHDATIEEATEAATELLAMSQHMKKVSQG
jgi:hypothetical protein